MEEEYDGLDSVSGGGATVPMDQPTKELVEEEEDLAGGKGARGSQGRERSTRGAPGGPLAVPGFVSGLINVRNFHDSCGALLAAVESELEDASYQDDDVDLSVDDLKIMTDAALVEKALTEVLQGPDALESPAAWNASNYNYEDAGHENQEDEPSGNLILTNRTEESGDCQQSLAVVGNGNRQVEFNFSVPPKIGKKKGRPFDRDQRAAALMDGNSRCEALARMKNDRDIDRENAPLHSLRAKKEREGLYARDQRPLRTLRFLTSVLKTPKLASKEQFEPMMDGEVLLTVEVYDNLKRNLKMQEFIVCGSQPLTALKDQIYCLTDTVAEKEHVKVPSSYFLIEETFYNDMRDPRARDYSLPIRQWVKDKGEAKEKWRALWDAGDFRRSQRSGSNSSGQSTLPPSFSAVSMAGVSFMDIECRLGAQFLYCHQGDCKHTIVIRDMRLVHPEDVQNAAAYPVLRYVHKLRHRKCSICGIYQARKVTVGDKLAPDNPCFFCDNCYYLLHYSSDGVLIYDDFQVQDYYHE